jgi:hypothetical protein
LSPISSSVEGNLENDTGHIISVQGHGIAHGCHIQLNMQMNGFHLLSLDDHMATCELGQIVQKVSLVIDLPCSFPMTSQGCLGCLLNDFPIKIEDTPVERGSSHG